MAITIEEFEAESVAHRRPTGSRAANTARVLTFLTDRTDRAFTVAEIREGSGVPRGSVCVALARLEDESRVRHRGEYWTAGRAPDATPMADERTAE